MSDSTTSRRREKPAKPYPDFPLFARATGRWAKRIRSKLHYFGPWDDPQNALQRYLEQEDYLHAGRIRQPNPEGLTVRNLVNRSLTGKKHSLEAGEFTPRTFRDCHSSCARIVAVFGRERLVVDLAAHDFEHLRNVMADLCSASPDAAGQDGCGFSLSCRDLPPDRSGGKDGH